MTGAHEMAAGVRSRAVSSRELVTQALERIDAASADRAFLALDGERALVAADAIDAAVRSDADVGPLAGVPIGVKDLTETAGLVTTYGSLAYEGNVPDEDAVLVQRLRAAGAVVVGKTNTPAFGWLGETKNALGADCVNPRDRTRTPGGSSGGSAAAVADGLVPIGTGTDSGGSIATPASFCGVVGLKASLGRIPTVPSPDDLLQWLSNGALATTVADAALAVRVMAGHDARDPVARRDPLPGLGGDARGLRVAFTADYGHFLVDPEVRAICEAAAQRLADLGAQVEEAAPTQENPIGLYMPLYMAEVRYGLLPIAAPGELFPECVAEEASLPHLSAAEFVPVLRRLWAFRSAQADFFARFDAICCPAAAVPAFPLREPPATIAGQAVTPGWTTFMPFPAAFNLCGNPTATVPAGATAGGLPVGLMIAAPPGREDTCVRLAAALEASTS